MHKGLIFRTYNCDSPKPLTLMQKKTENIFKKMSTVFYIEEITLKHFRWFFFSTKIFM